MLLGVSVCFVTLTSMGRAQNIALNLPAPTDDSDFQSHSAAKIKLGQVLFYDRVLSGTYRVSCATCHNHDRASSNGVLLDDRSEREADDLAINGSSVYDPLKPSTRHAPALFNLGAKQFTILFSDGRVAKQRDGSLASPAGNDLPPGLETVVSAQALFPFVASDELTGTVDSDLTEAANKGHPAIWAALMKRIERIDGYAPLFKSAFPDLKEMKHANIAQVANAIGAFVATEWRSDNAPFDRYLRGDATAMNVQQKRGMELFFGKAQCSSCHTGVFQTDHKFYGSGLPVWRFDEPFERQLDGTLGKSPLQGREAVTGNPKHRHHFRTPSLRNVEKTAPYGWAGSYEKLPDFVRAHADPYNEIVAFVAQGIGGFSPPDNLAKVVDGVLDNQTLKPVELTEMEVASLVAFLTALTDEKSIKGRLGKPAEVPSSLALD